MKNLPSKELLNEVLPFGDINSLISYGLSSDGDILLQYEDIDEIFSLYELAHKCKEWAYRRGFLIGSNCRQGITVIDINTHTVLNHFDVYIEDFTEFEIKACQWILENK